MSFDEPFDSQLNPFALFRTYVHKCIVNAWVNIVTLGQRLFLICAFISQKLQLLELVTTFHICLHAVYKIVCWLKVNETFEQFNSNFNFKLYRYGTVHSLNWCWIIARKLYSVLAIAFFQFWYIFQNTFISDLKAKPKKKIKLQKKNYELITKYEGGRILRKLISKRFLQHP